MDDRPVHVTKQVKLTDAGERVMHVSVDLVELFDPYDRQARFVQSDAPTSYFLGGIGSGKSYGLMMWALRKILQNPGRTGLIAGRTMNDIDKVLLPVLYQLLQRWHDVTGVRLLIRFDRGNQTLHFSNGAAVHLYGYNRIDKIRGLNLTWAALDEVEWSEADPDEVFDVVGGRIRERSTVCKGVFAVAYASSPNGLRGVTKRFYDAQQMYAAAIQSGDRKQLETARTFYLVTATSFDNPHLPPAYFVRMSSMSKRRYEQEVRGKVLRPSHAIYDLTPAHLVDWHPARPSSPPRLRVIGVDWGNQGKHVAVDFDVEVRTGVWTLVEELIDDENPVGKFIARLASWIRRPGRSHDPFLIAGDRAVVDANMALRRQFSNSHYRVMDSKLEQQVTRGIELVQYMLDPADEAVRLVFNKTLARVITTHTAPALVALRGYAWLRDRAGIPTRVPHKDDVNDHVPDAIRYAVVGSLRWLKELHAGRNLMMWAQDFDDDGPSELPKFGHSSRQT